MVNRCKTHKTTSEFGSGVWISRLFPGGRSLVGAQERRRAERLPWWVASLASAVGRSRLSFCMTMAVFTLPDFSRRFGGGGLVDACGGHDDALGSVDEFGVGGLEVDHEVAVDGSGFDHDAGGEHVEDELGGGAGFEARAAGEDFGAGDRGDGDVGEVRPWGSWGRR